MDLAADCGPALYESWWITVTFDTDVLVVGSGFGGSVAALRLVEKGYRVQVYESGRRFADEDFAKTSWNISRFLWLPRFKCFGVQRIHRLPHVMILAGAGVGGGSLNYANTLYVPPKEFFTDPQWAHLTDWADELTSHYDQAARMLGVVTNPSAGPAEEIMRAVADEMGVGHTFSKTPVGVFFGVPGKEVADPYFGGVGPRRTGCTQCGNCMVGCRVGAKNTLVKNYLALAERLGAVVTPMRTVMDIREIPDGYAVTTERTGAWVRRDRQTVTTQQVVLAAGTWGTQSLLHRLRHSSLPRLSPRLGWVTRTNSEALLGATARTVPDVDLTAGVAITSSFHPDGNTHIENCRYGKGSNAMGLLGTLLVDGGPWRLARFFGQILRHPRRFGYASWAGRFSERSIIGLVMQSLDNSLTVTGRRRRFLRFLGFPQWGLTSTAGHGQPNPSWIPAGHDSIRRIARELTRRTGVPADPGGTLGDVLNAPLTAHFLGGCVIGSGPQDSVVDAYHRVHGYPGLHIVDGSTVSANLGVNPALTITALAERALSLWPNAGQVDPRPKPGRAYRRLAPIPAGSPAVPQGAPADPSRALGREPAQ